MDPDAGFMGQSAGLKIQSDGDYVTLWTSLGIRMKWDGKSDVAITVDRDMNFERVSGLCGYYNDDPTDDFTPFDTVPFQNLDFRVQPLPLTVQRRPMSCHRAADVHRVVESGR